MLNHQHLAAHTNLAYQISYLSEIATIAQQGFVSSYFYTIDPNQERLRSDGIAQMDIYQDVLKQVVPGWIDAIEQLTEHIKLQREVE